MSAMELIKEIQSLPEQEQEKVFEFVLRSRKSAWATPRPPGYFADSNDRDEINAPNWLAFREPKVIVP